jgi:hypothetical protein
MIKLAFYGSSLLSSYWNGAATYYRGVLSALAPAATTSPSTSRMHTTGSRIATSLHRPGARVRVYAARPEPACEVLAEATAAVVVVKASGVSVFDAELPDGAIAMARPDTPRVFWGR